MEHSCCSESSESRAPSNHLFIKLNYEERDVSGIDFSINYSTPLVRRRSRPRIDRLQSPPCLFYSLLSPDQDQKLLRAQKAQLGHRYVGPVKLPRAKLVPGSFCGSIDPATMTNNDKCCGGVSQILSWCCGERWDTESY